MDQLPILAFREAIMGCESPYIIVEAATGAGKSTEVPQWYFESGYRVLVTEPLIETVIGTSEYVAQLMGVRFGNTVGYRTGASRCDSPDTEVLYCTDGLALVRELSSGNRYDVLVIDELHEWNSNQSTLEAWAWMQLQKGESFFKKIVVLSATLNSTELSQKRGNAPIFKVPGRQHPIVEQPAGNNLSADVRRLVGEGYDVLVFQPGENEILQTIADLGALDAELIPFYGKLERHEKDRAYRSYARPKVVVSTNALETGRTLLPSEGRKLAVVDSGMERRVELVGGIEGLYLKPIARTRGKQRKGRTGRVGDGVYIDHCPSSDRADYPTPEILRCRLDQTVLRLAVAGYDATELPFFHDLDIKTIAEAKRALRLLGAITKDGSVTKTGHIMARLPISVQFARMIVEAQSRGVVDDVVTIAAILESGSIRDKTSSWRSLTSEQESDLLAELDVWNAAQGRTGEQLRAMGVFSPSFWRAKELRRKISEALRSHRVEFSSNGGTRQDIVKSCVAGMVDHLYKEKYGDYQNGDDTARQLARESVLTGRPDWIVGLPKDIEVKAQRGGTFMLRLVTMATRVDQKLLTEVAPQLVEKKTGLNPIFSAEKDSVVSTTEIYFNGTKVGEEIVPDPSHQKAKEIFCRHLAARMV